MGLDVSVIFKIAGVGIAVSLIVTILKQVGKDDYSSWVTLGGFLYVLYLVATIVQDLFMKIKEVFLFQ